MGYALSATVANEASTSTPPKIYLSTFGVQIGDSEVRTYDCPEGMFGKIRETFRALEKNKQGKPKSMTLSWFPSSDQSRLFHDLKGKKLRITVFIEQYNSKAKWTLVFTGVEIIGNPKKETKIFKDKTPRDDERVNTSFMKFKDDPAP
jgi:hypothetical protein